MAEEADGFFGRWARRKTAVLQGTVPGEPSPAAAAPAPAAAPEPVSASDLAPPATPAVAGQPPVLSLEDVRGLTAESDFTPFMAKGVGADVRNAAMKKLFADPHFNIMDGLDTYVDDYSVSDPIPEEMLRQMASAKFLRLFDEDEEEKEDDAGPRLALREDADDALPQSVAQSPPDIEPPDPATRVPDEPSHPGPPHDASVPRASQEAHADTDLRLQPDHAPPAAGPGSSA
ncbi:MAG: hypothetical protein JWQ72_1822 [Polaromonas sp.]|nr:hypothetical protein [Polaromonas sp.]